MLFLARSEDGSEEAEGTMAKEEENNSRSSLGGGGGRAAAEAGAGATALGPLDRCWATEVAGRGGAA